MAIPMVDLKRELEFLHSSVQPAMETVLQHGRFINGPEVSQLEEELRVYTGTSAAIGCGNGTDALQIALMAIGLEPGDEVITTPFTFAATVEVISLLKARPVFVDIDPRTYLLDVKQVESHISDRTRAIIPVHLFGQMVDMTGLREIASAHKLVLIEDMAQAIGATQGKQRAGSCGELACTSFFPSKNLGAYGDGGMVFATDEELGKRVKMIRNHGQQQRYRHDIVGVNSRLDTLQAAILLKKLPHLNKWNARRAEVANLYEQLLTADVEKPVTATGNSHVYHQYSIMVEQRDELREFLSEREIASAIHYPIPLNEQPAYQHYGGEPTPTAHAVAQRIMALPISPWISDQEVAAVCKGVAEFMSG